jgi:hypothetical protein
VEKNQLIMAEVELLPPAENTAIPSGYEHMAVLLQQIIGQLGPPYTTMQTDYESADWVSARLVELLPLHLADKQQLLNMDDIQQRFEKLQAALSRIDT